MTPPHFSYNLSATLKWSVAFQSPFRMSGCSGMTSVGRPNKWKLILQYFECSAWYCMYPDRQHTKTGWSPNNKHSTVHYHAPSDPVTSSCTAVDFTLYKGWSSTCHSNWWTPSLEIRMILVKLVYLWYFHCRFSLSVAFVKHQWRQGRSFPVLKQYYHE